MREVDKGTYRTFKRGTEGRNLQKNKNDVEGTFVELDEGLEQSRR